MTSNRIPPLAPTLLADLVAAGLDVPILDPNDTRWERLRPSCLPGLDLRDRFRGALIGGAIGDAMGRPNEGARASEARGRVRRAGGRFGTTNRGMAGRVDRRGPSLTTPR